MKTHSIKRTAACLLAVSMLLSFGLISAAAESVFEDIEDGASYAEAVAYLQENGISNGTSASSFSPNSNVTTAQLATFLGRVAGVEVDNTGDGWSSGYAAWAAENSLLPDSITVESINTALNAFAVLENIPAATVTGITRGDLAPALMSLHKALSSPVRSTAYGDVMGTVQNGVDVYYGVPYGADPVGELRWSAPTAPAAWTETLDCTEKAPIAMQMATVYTAEGSTTALAGTTDCLNLDIFTPENAENLPVMVYIHGGNNQTGGSYEEIKDGTYLAATDECVLVSLNYRTGLLGFNALPALQTEEGSTGNYALLDIAFALEWVRDNVSSFGGDPNNVTVSGFSAGGRNVMAMLVSPIFEGLFQRAVVFSGGMTICDEEQGALKDAEIIAPLAVEDGKAETEEEAAEWLMGTGSDVKDYLYSLSAERLTQLMTNAGIRMAKFPHLFGDDVVLPSGGFENADYVNDVPVIMLTGTSEFSLFASDSYYSTLEGEELQAAAQAFAVKYGSDFYRTFNTQLSAETMAESGYTSNMYLVQFEYGGADSATTIGMGSFHGIFVPAISPTHGYTFFHDFSGAGYTSLAADFNTYLKNFLYTGDPNSSSPDVVWDNWTSESKQTLCLDADEETGTSTAVLKNVFKTNDEIIAEIEADTAVPDEVKSVIISTIMNGRWFSDDLDAHFNTPSLW